MRSVNLAALKAKLSAHLEYVKTGEEVVVCERNKPIARIVPIHIDDQEEHEKELIARGVMTPPKKKRTCSGTGMVSRPPQRAGISYR